MKPDAELRLVGGRGRLFVRGDWTARHIEELSRLCAGLAREPGLPLARGLDLSETGALDTSGAFLINKLRFGGRPPDYAGRAGREERDGQAERAELALLGASPEQIALLDLVGRESRPAPGVSSGGRRGLASFPPARLAAAVGEAVCNLGAAALERLNFLGAFLLVLGRNIVRPSGFRLTSTVCHMEQAGVNAIPIVCLLSFLIGTVLAYMTAGQLAHFGAEIFVVKLLEVGILREMGVLITAILAAGRSGSAFAAQIGAMLANQEIDAMRSMGMDPLHFLVLPRVLALALMLPALTLLANLAGLFGGLCAVWLSLDITPQVFIGTLQRNIYFGNVLVGLVKAPFFALAIGLVGCFTGFKAGPSADSVGRMTTRAVVEAIFLVITLDALFALFFSKIGF